MKRSDEISMQAVCQEEKPQSREARTVHTYNILFEQSMYRIILDMKSKVRSLENENCYCFLYIHEYMQTAQNETV